MLRDATGKSAMVYAAARGFDDIVRRLLEAGVDPRARYGNDLTALMWAAGHEDGVGPAAVARVVELLLGARRRDRRRRQSRPHRADDRRRARRCRDRRISSPARRRSRASRTRTERRALDLAANDGVRAKLVAA